MHFRPKGKLEIFFRLPLSVLILLVVMGAPQFSLAKEDAHGGGGGHEAPAEASGEGHEAGAKKVEEAPGWLEIEAQISSLEAKVQSKTRAIESLIEEKNHLKAGDSSLSEVVKQLGQEDRERRKLAEELEKQKTILAFRFPERGAAKNRKYQKVEIKSISEIEANMGVDGRLNRSVKRMRSQYGAEEPRQKSGKQTEKPKSPEPEGTIILQK